MQHSQGQPDRHNASNNRSTRAERATAGGGFTLVELLVTIGIIAVLMGILLPALTRAREQSRQVACLAQLQAVGVGLRLYAEESGGRLPNGNPAGTVLDPAGMDAVLIELDRRYVRSPRAFWCPADDPTQVPQAIESAAEEMPNSARVSYEFYSLYWMPEMGPKLAAIKDAPLAWDINGGGPDDGKKSHRKGGNVVFADGHASFQTAGDWDGANWPHPADRHYR